MSRMEDFPVVQTFSYMLAHAPELVRYGAKPKREIKSNPDLGPEIDAHLRSFEEAVSYPPNQVFLGNLHPEDLAKRPEPWWQNPVAGASPDGAYGPFLNQLAFYGFLKMLDQFNLVWFTPEFTGRIRNRIASHPLLYDGDLDKLGDGIPMSKSRYAIENNGALPLYFQNQLIGSFQRDHDDDEALQAEVLLENLVTKASGALAVRQLLARARVEPGAVDYIMSCSEEAVGDRYQRGGGNLAKAVGEACKLLNATGSDVKAFCAGPVYAIVHAASLVKAGTFDTVIVL